MRRSICYTEPKTAFAGESKTWKFVYAPSSPLLPGARLKLDLLSKGREFDWELPQTDLKKKNNLIWLETPEKNIIPAIQVETLNNATLQYEFTLSEHIEAGKEVCIFIGTPNPGNAKSQANRAQLNTLRRRPFELHVDSKGKGDYKELEYFHVDIRGNELDSIRIIVPSIVSKNQRFDVTVRFEDKYGNLTGKAPEGTLVEFSYQRLRENINWKLFVPETGFINLPNLYFNEEGTYRIKLKNLTTKQTYHSTPIKCITDIDKQILWGSFHSETLLYDAKSNIESCLRYIRDENAFQFFGTSSSEAEEETPLEIWKGIGAHISEFNEDDRFSTFLGLQWAGDSGTEGLRQLIYTKDLKPILRKKESKANHLKKIYNSHTAKDLFSIPSFTMSSLTPYNFKDFSQQYEKLVEIYNAWGSSECTKAEGNTKPIYSKSKKGTNEYKEGSIRTALNRNCRFGFVAGGYDDRGPYKKLFMTDQVQYTPGVTAMLVGAHTKDGIIQAVNKRSCFATTGARMILGFSIANAPIGSEISTKNKPGINYNRHISGYAVGTDHVKEIAIIRNGLVYKTINPNPNDEYSYEFTIDDSDPLSSILIQTSKDEPKFAYYYMRVTQEDGHIGWASPIWINANDQANPSKKS